MGCVYAEETDRTGCELYDAASLLVFFVVKIMSLGRRHLGLFSVYSRSNEAMIADGLEGDFRRLMLRRSLATDWARVGMGMKSLSGGECLV